jgi:hypothetical protein
MFEIKEVEKIDSTGLSTVQKITYLYYLSKAITVVYLIVGGVALVVT